MQSNDSREGVELDDALSKYKGIPGIPSHTNFKKKVGEQALIYDVFGFCMSEKPDNLSQWRGYGDDGNGICFGLSTQAIRNLTNTSESGALEFDQVIYDYNHRNQYANFTLLSSINGASIVDLTTSPPTIVENPLLEIKDEAERKEALEMSADQALLKLRFKLKNEAFNDEAEWRLFEIIDRSRFKDTKYFARDNMLVPYHEIVLKPDPPDSTANETPLLCSVILGPKNKTPIDVVQGMLRNKGHKIAASHISRSAASYN